MIKLDFVTIILIIVQAIVIPWAVWVTSKLFKISAENALLKQQVSFLEDNLVKDVQTIKDSVEQNNKAAHEANDRVSNSIKELDKKIDLFIGNELHLLKKALIQKDETKR